MHVLVNTLWDCDLSCPYCLLPHIKINRMAPRHGWAEWAVALRDHTTPGSIIDFAGGDPLLFPGLAHLLRVLAESRRRWAITTNGIHTPGVDELLRVRPGGCALVNISDHPGTYDITANLARLQAVYPVAFNRVDHPKAGQRRGAISHLIPFQRWEDGTELDGIARRCDSGQRHWVADPSGDVFRCNPAMAQGHTPIGNLFKRTLVIPEPIDCMTGCSTCYTAVGPAAWDVAMEPLAVPA